MTWQAWLSPIAPIVALVTAIVAVITFWKNAKTRRAEYLSSVHRDFLDKRYRKMRTLIDEPARSEELAQAIADEETAFTDFLNYFEFVAYLQKLGMLTCDDVEAILGYYLALLRQNVVIREYVREPSRSFENLNRLLATIEKNER